eukprot:12899728-Prorocentrum_lima.AAC.1
MEQSIKALDGYRINFGLLMNWQLELVPAYVLRKHPPSLWSPRSHQSGLMGLSLTPTWTSPVGNRRPQCSWCLTVPSHGEENDDKGRTTEPHSTIAASRPPTGGTTPRPTQHSKPPRDEALHRD